MGRTRRMTGSAECASDICIVIVLNLGKLYSYISTSYVRKYKLASMPCECNNNEESTFNFGLGRRHFQGRL